MTREDAIKTLKELRRETNDYWYEKVYSMAIQALETVTSVNKPQGKWINGHSTNDFYYKKCNQCFAVIDDIFFGESSFDVNFCPNCGADMKGANGGK